MSAKTQGAWERKQELRSYSAVSGSLVVPSYQQRDFSFMTKTLKNGGFLF